MQNCHQIFFRNNVKRIRLGKRCVLPRFRKIQESYGYSTGILRLQYGNLACSYSTGSLQLEYENLTVRLLESYSYNTGILQLQYGKLAVTVRESYRYSSGILLLQYGNLAVTERKSYKYITGSLQLQNSCCWFHPESDHSSCSGLGSCTSGSSFATSTSLTSLVLFRCLYMQMSTVYGGLCSGDVVTKSAHRKKPSLRFTKYT